VLIHVQLLSIDLHQTNISQHSHDVFAIFYQICVKRTIIPCLARAATQLEQSDSRITRPWHHNWARGSDLQRAAPVRAMGGQGTRNQRKTLARCSCFYSCILWRNQKLSSRTADPVKYRDKNIHSEPKTSAILWKNSIPNRPKLSFSLNYPNKNCILLLQQNVIYKQKEGVCILLLIIWRLTCKIPFQTN
jgi:hypothetical protein